MTSQALRGHLETNLAQINKQLEAVMELAIELDTAPYQLRSSDGAYLLTPLLLAKSQALLGLTNLRLESKRA